LILITGHDEPSRTNIKNQIMTEFIEKEYGDEIREYFDKEISK